MYRQEDHPDEKERETNSRRRGSPMALMKKAIRKRLSVQHPAGFITARAHASPPISIPARARARARGETRDEHLCIKSPRFSFFPRWKPSETATRPTDLSGDQNSTSLPPPEAARAAEYETDPFFFFRRSIADAPQRPHFSHRFRQTRSRQEYRESRGSSSGSAGCLPRVSLRANG